MDVGHVVTIILGSGIIGFLFKQYVWTRWFLPVISRKPKLMIKFSDNTTIVNLKTYGNIDISAEVNSRLEEERR